MNKQNKKILIIEDESQFQEILKKIFIDEGLSVLTAKDGEDGADIAEKERPDLIISDMLMPKLDGMGMAKKIKEKNLDIPIIFLTNVKEEIDGNKEFDYLLKVNSSMEDIVAKAKNKLGI